jgi:abortive infection Abi-like protein
MPREGEIDIHLTGTHLAQVERLDDDEWVVDTVQERLSLYRTTAGQYVLAYSGAKCMDSAKVCDSAEAVASFLPDRNDYLGPLEKLLLVEAGKIDKDINALARLDLRADSTSDLVRSVIDASQIVDTAQLVEHIQRIEDALENDPAQTIGSAKELVEAVGKLVVRYFEPEAADSQKFRPLMRNAFKALNLTIDDIPDPKRGRDAMQQIFSGLAQIVDGTAELRNLYGTGHGRFRKSGANARHARLVVHSSATLCYFLLKTLDARKAVDESKNLTVSAATKRA